MPKLIWQGKKDFECKHQILIELRFFFCASIYAEDDDEEEKNRENDAMHSSEHSRQTKTR